MRWVHSLSSTQTASPKDSSVSRSSCSRVYCSSTHSLAWSAPFRDTPHPYSVFHMCIYCFLCAFLSPQPARLWAPRMKGVSQVLCVPQDQTSTMYYAVFRLIIGFKMNRFSVEFVSLLSTPCIKVEAPSLGGRRGHKGSSSYDKVDEKWHPEETKYLE